MVIVVETKRKLSIDSIEDYMWWRVEDGGCCCDKHSS